MHSTLTHTLICACLLCLLCISESWAILFLYCDCYHFCKLYWEMVKDKTTSGNVCLWLIQQIKVLHPIDALHHADHWFQLCLLWLTRDIEGITNLYWPFVSLYTPSYRPESLHINHESHNSNGKGSLLFNHCVCGEFLSATSWWFNDPLYKHCIE